MASSLKQIAICTLLCTLALTVNSRFVTKRQYQQQQQQDDVEQFDVQNQQQQGDFGQFDGQNQLQQQQQGGVSDEGDLVQLAVEEAEQNPDIITEDLNNQQLNQFGQDLNQYENELAQEAELGGHKGVVTKEDIQHVQEKNEKQPWYIRLKNWAGRKLEVLTDKITKY